MKTIFEQLNEKQSEDANSDVETDADAAKASSEYLDFIEGRTGKRDSGINGNSRRQDKA